MYANPQRTIDKGLASFQLIAGQGDGKTTACAMTMLGWLAGHKQWKDHPVCAHDALADIVISANDEDEGQSKSAQCKRANLVKLGYEGVLDTWWIPEEVINWLTDKDQSGTQYGYAVAVLKATTKWKKERFRVRRIKKYEVRKLHTVLNASQGKGYVWVRVS